MKGGRLTERNYGVDLLRIVSMFMICVTHVLGHGGILDGNNLTAHGHVAYIIHLTCFGAVNVYAITSGYVCFNSKNRASSIINLWLQVCFYSVFIAVVGMVCSWTEDKTVWHIVDSFFPVVNNTYWYFTAYFCLFFFMPIINYGVRHAPKRAVEGAIVAIFLIFGVANSIGEKSVFSLNNGYTVIWIASMYLLGAYIRKYNPLNNFNWWKSLIAYVLCVAVAFLSKRLIESYEVNERYQLSRNAFIFYPSPIIFLQSLFLFNAFRRINVKGVFVKIISVLSPLTFGVYLIHDNPIIRKTFVSGKFAYYLEYSVAKMVFMIILTAVIIFSICMAIEFLRSQLFKFIKVKSFSTWLAGLFTKLFDRIFKKETLETELANEQEKNSNGEIINEENSSNFR